MSLEHKSSVESLGYIYSNSQKYIVLVKIIDISFMPKIIRVLRSCSMKIFSKCPTINISKLNFWLVICIDKNFIWITLKMILSIFRFFCILRLQIFISQPNIIQTIHQWKDYSFSFHMMQKSQFQKNGPLWLVLCSRVSHAVINARVASL